MSTQPDLDAPKAERSVCPNCLLDNSSTAAFCTRCGAPIGMVANIDPMQSIQSEGFGYRSATEGPPKLIVLVGMWLLFVPLLLLAPFAWLSGDAHNLPQTCFFTLFALLAAAILFRTTRNYVVKSRPAQPRGS